jgi:uncharacterized protein YdeI (YjbR/CyaY-like superfamily)
MKEKPTSQADKANPKIDLFLGRAEAWRKETEMLRDIALGCGLTEELKWGKPCYAFQGSNVVLIQGFKEYCALLFCKGSLLKDAQGILRKIGEHTQVARQARFTHSREIAGMKATLRAYILEAIEAERSGMKVQYKKNPEPVPKELKDKLDAIPALKSAFASLTPGRQRAYILLISSAKQSKTRESRVEKHMPQILRGKGPND